jgi:hypothetical protein
MNELRRQFPPPKLSPYFAARFNANLPRPSASRFAILGLRAYWILGSAITLYFLAPISWPTWILYAAVPAGFGIALGSKRLR